MFYAEAPQGTWAEFNRNGWINSKTFIKWSDKLIECTKASKTSPVLVLVDGQMPYLKNIKVIDIAEENGVLIIGFPPYTSYRLQPIDVSFMRTLSNHTTYEIKKYSAINNFEDTPLMIFLMTVRNAFRMATLLKDPIINAFRQT